jgi:hypothetical protein
MGKRDGQLKVAYLTSLKLGLSAFNYREIEELRKIGIRVLNNKKNLTISLICEINWMTK